MARFLLYPFQVGDIVRLRVGGVTELLVVDTFDTKAGRIVVCAWRRGEGQVDELEFGEHTLSLVKAAGPRVFTLPPRIR